MLDLRVTQSKGEGRWVATFQKKGMKAIGFLELESPTKEDDASKIRHVDEIQQISSVWHMIRLSRQQSWSCVGPTDQSARTTSSFCPPSPPDDADTLSWAMPFVLSRSHSAGQDPAPLEFVIHKKNHSQFLGFDLVSQQLNGSRVVRLDQIPLGSFVFLPLWLRAVGLEIATKKLLE